MAVRQTVISPCRRAAQGQAYSSSRSGGDSSRTSATLRSGWRAPGFVALAPDLYHGEMATEPDGAGKLMMGLNVQEAAKDLSGAVDYLNEKSTGSGIGVIGFCMGGGLALVLACQRPDAVKAVAPFYGVIPWSSARPDWSKLEGVLEGHYAENDDFASPVVVRALEGELKDLGKRGIVQGLPRYETRLLQRHPLRPVRRGRGFVRVAQGDRPLQARARLERAGS